MKHIPEPKQGDIWYTFLPWKHKGNELEWLKIKSKGEIRPAFVASGLRLQPLKRALVTGVGSAYFPDEPHAVAFTESDNAVIHGGSIRCGQIQSFPLQLEERIQCDGKHQLSTGDSPFIELADTCHREAPDILGEVEDVLAGKMFSPHQLTPGDIIGVRFLDQAVTPCIVINHHISEKVNLVTVIQSVTESLHNYRDNSYYFIVNPDELTNGVFPLIVGLGLVRTVDFITRCAPLVRYGQLVPKRLNALTECLQQLL